MNESLIGQQVSSTHPTECIFVVVAPAKQLNFTPVLDWFKEFSTEENEINGLIIKAPKADYSKDVSDNKPLNYRSYHFD